jgi:hypothetical protein
MPTRAVQGLQQDLIQDFRYSFNTFIQYIHYDLVFPNDNMKFMISGTYILKVYEDNDPDNLVLTRRFMVYSKKVPVGANVRRPALMELRDTHQELDAVADISKMALINAPSATRFIMLQNQCKNAIEEMTEVLYTTDLILNWVNQYLSIYDEIKDEDDECIYKNIKYVEEFFELWQSKSYEKDLILEYKDAELAVLEYNEIEIIDWLDKYHNLYYCVLMPSNSLADFVCDIEYKYKLGNREYQSKELYYVEKFTDLYFTSNHK